MKDEVGKRWMKQPLITATCPFCGELHREAGPEGCEFYRGPLSAVDLYPWVATPFEVGDSATGLWTSNDHARVLGVVLHPRPACRVVCRSLTLRVPKRPERVLIPRQRGNRGTPLDEGRWRALWPLDMPAGSTFRLMVLAPAACILQWGILVEEAAQGQWVVNRVREIERQKEAS